jgi:hypothetical protein
LAIPKIYVPRSNSLARRVPYACSCKHLVSQFLKYDFDRT